MTQNRLICSIFKSRKKTGMFLYVDKLNGMEKVPEPLKDMFGAPEHVMDMLVDESKSFARIKGQELLSAIMDRGYYLQMPDNEENLLAAHRKELGLDPVVNKNTH